MLWDRMIRAAKLESSLYNEVEQDVNATSQALLVVAIVAVLAGIGGLLLAIMIPFLGFGGGIRFLIGGIVGALVGWAIWSFATYWVGTKFFGGKATYGELLRCLGFAYTPNALGFFVFIPGIGFLIAFVGFVWSLVAAVIGIREALDVNTTNAIIAGVIGWVIALVVSLILSRLGLPSAMGFGGMG